MFQWESYVSLGVLLLLLLGLLLVLLIIVIIVPRSVFTKCSSIKLYKEDKRLLVNSDPWPPAEQKLKMPFDIDLFWFSTKWWMQRDICSDWFLDLATGSLEPNFW